MPPITLSDASPKPLTIERSGEKVILRLHLNVLKLGASSAIWLRESLHKTLNGGVTGAQYLEIQGNKLLTVLNESGYIFIIGTKCRFNMKREVAQKIIEWIDADRIAYLKK